MKTKRIFLIVVIITALVVNMTTNQSGKQANSFRNEQICHLLKNDDGRC